MYQYNIFIIVNIDFFIILHTYVGAKKSGAYLKNSAIFMIFLDMVTLYEGISID